MATHSSALAWKNPWTEEPGRLQSLGSQSRIRLSDFTFTFHFGEGNGNPLQCSCLENPRDGAAWWAAVCGVAQSRTRLEQLSRRRRRIQDWKRREWRRARGREEREREREGEGERVHEKVLWLLLSYVFSSTWACPMQIGLSQECCLFCLKSSLWSSDLPLTFLVF